MQGINGNTAIVTGAASGIGRATAERFGAEGANVVVADIDPTGGTETVESIEEAGGDAIFVETDVSDPDDVESLVAETVATYGGLDFAHNNAGIGEQVSSFVDMTTEEWDRTVGINLRGVMLCMREELQHMADTAGGAIVNTSSTAGMLSHPTAPHYTAAKHGVLGLTKAAAFEYADRGIRVNAVCPGVIDTNIGDDDISPEAAKAVTPMNRIGDPSEVGDVVVRLCSDDASFMTSVGIPVDGGMTAGRVWRRE